MFGLFGNIAPPPGIDQYVSKAGNQGGAIFLFFSNLLKIAGVIAGLYALVQLILAGYTYISSSGDTKNTEKAWAMIWQSLLGLFIVASAFTIASVLGKILNIDILNPTIYGPK